MFLDLWHRLISWWRRPTPIDNEAGETADHVVTASQPKKKPRKSFDTDGVFDFRGTILDQLDHYFLVLSRMKRADREAYDFFSRLGAHIVPARSHVRDQKLSPWWKETLPAHGGVFYGDSEIEAVEDKRKVLIPRALYFVKVKRTAAAPEIQPVSHGAVYKLTVYWDKPNDSNWNRRVGKHGVVQQFPVVVHDDGTVRVLRILENKRIEATGKHGRERGKRFTIPVRRWGIPDCYNDWAKTHGEPVEEFLRQVFIGTAEHFMEANSAMTRIAVSKGQLKAVFAVAMERTPYFFRDRDLTTTKNGTRRPIFHVVRPHRRRIATGLETLVRLHFRGEREFDWNGYSVSITVPGWHHFNLAEFDLAVLDSESEEAKRAALESDLITPGEIASVLDKSMQEGRGRLERRAPKRQRQLGKARK